MISEKISIIVPVYNTEKYLDKCIKSIQEQTYSNIEIILVDDGSTDNSLAVCNKYALEDKRIHVIHIDNGGVSNARNIGIEHATGRYIGFVDSDDSICKDMFEVLAAHIEKRSLPICLYNIVNENQNVICSRHEGINNEIVNKKDFFVLCENILLNSPVNKLYDANIIQQNKIRFDSNLSLGEDLLFVLEYIRYIDRFEIINQPLYYYLSVESESLSHKYRKDFYEIQKKIILTIERLLLDDDETFNKYSRRFYTFSLDLLLQALNNTFSKRSEENLFQKMKMNSCILKEEIFRRSLANANVSNLRKGYVQLLKMKTYVPVYLYIQIINLVKRLRGMKND